MDSTINGRTPDEIKKGLECCMHEGECKRCPYQGEKCTITASGDALAYIQQLEEDKKRLQERICNQRRSLRVLHAMYEWALGRLQKAKLNDRAHFQAFLRERGYDLATMELPETRYQQLENHIGELTEMVQQLKRERDAAVRDMYHAASDGGSFCDICKYKGEPCDERKAADIECWQWRGVQEVE